MRFLAVSIERVPRLVRFALVGGTCAAFQQACLVSFVRGGVQPNVANLIAFLVAAQINFVLSDAITWRDRRESHVSFAATGRRLLRFNAMVCSTLIVNQVVFALVSPFTHYFVAGLLAILVTASLNYAVSRNLVFALAPLRLVAHPVAVTGTGVPAHASASSRSEDRTAMDDHTHHITPASLTGTRSRRADAPSVAHERAAIGGRGIAVVVALGALVLGGFTLRALFLDLQSAFMDEGTYILTGRHLIEGGEVYAYYLYWAYGSYLWPLMAGAADMMGGIGAVRLLTAILGASMVVPTAFLAAHLAPPHLKASRWTAGLIAGLVMATFPTAIAVGRFGTYDLMAGAAFMGGVALLATLRERSRRWVLLTAAAVLFTAFLSKYIVALYFPFICLYLMVAPRKNWRVSLRNVVWFVAPLSLACAAYFAYYHTALLALLHFSSSYTDLKSPVPLREYVEQRPELWALAAFAAFGWRAVSRPVRLITVGGAAVILGAQAATRADADWWKHSIYLIFFLSPLAAYALAPTVERIFNIKSLAAMPRLSWRAVATLLAAGVMVPVTVAALITGVGVLSARPDFDRLRQAGSLVLLAVALLALLFAPLVEILRERAKRKPLGVSRRTLGAVFAAVVVVPVLLGSSLLNANWLLTHYPNLNPAVSTIRREATGARAVLTDDSAVRYYLYGIVRWEQINDPFSFEYQNLKDMEAYRKAISDRFFDVIVLDGGVGPLGKRLRAEFGSTLIPRYYERVYSMPNGFEGQQTEVYRARKEVSSERTVASDATVYRFAGGTEGWGARGSAGLTPGAQVSTSTTQTFEGHPTLRFAVGRPDSLVTVRQEGRVTRVRAQVYVETTKPNAEARIGMVGFDRNWQWHDDDYTQVVPPERWTEITWELAEPGVYNEIGLTFSSNAVRTVYVGQVTVEP